MISGPATEPLPWHDVLNRDGRIWVRLGKKLDGPKWLAVRGAIRHGGKRATNEKTAELLQTPSISHDPAEDAGPPVDAGVGDRLPDLSSGIRGHRPYDASVLRALSGAAYDRILHITTTLRYGRLLRNLHFLAANVLLIAGVLHLARVFFTGSYQGRWLNWTYGLLLLGLIFFSNYTGYLLPWDQTSYWAIKVGSNLVGYFPEIGPSLKRFLLGGEDIGPETLIRSFALHVAVLPFLWLTLISLHLWRIRKDGGVAAPEEAEAERIPSSPWLFRAELAVGLLTVSLLFCWLFSSLPP